MFKILHLPTGTYVKFIKTETTYNKQRPPFRKDMPIFTDYYCSDIAMASDYLNQEFEVFDDLVVATNNRLVNNIDRCKLSKTYYKANKKHFEIVEV